MKSIIHEGKNVPNSIAWPNSLFEKRMETIIIILYMRCIDRGGRRAATCSASSKRRSFSVERKRERRTIGGHGEGAASPLLFSGAREFFGAPALPLLFESNNSHKMKAVKNVIQ